MSEKRTNSASWSRSKGVVTAQLIITSPDEWLDQAPVDCNRVAACRNDLLRLDISFGLKASP